MDIIEKAESFARGRHTGQKDDSGADYFEAHVEQVVRILRQITSDEAVLSAGYLHDTIEDCGVTLDMLTEIFGAEIAGIVWEVTHEGNKEQGYYFPRLNTHKAILVKFADRLSNLSRMEAWTTDRQVHYMKRSRFWKLYAGEGTTQ